MTVAAAPVAIAPVRRFHNAAEWLRALGSIPLERIIFDPVPGTATEADLLRSVAEDKLCELIESAQLDGEQVVPGFAMPVADLFRNLPPRAPAVARASG